MTCTRARWRLLPLLLALCIVMPVLAACGDDDNSGDEPVDVSLALDWYPWAAHTGIYLALANGYFEDEGLNVTVYVPGDPATGLQLVASGEDDFVISYQADVMIARGEGLPVQSVAALVQHPLNSIMALGSSGITTPANLAGKKVGVSGLPSDEALLEAVLAQEGVALDQVEIVNVGFNLVTSLLSGQVDAVIGAYWVHESLLIEQEGETVNVIKLEEWGVPDYYELVLVTTEEMVDDDGETIEKFVRALQQGYAAAEDDPTAALDALIAAAPDTDRALEEAGLPLLIPFWTDNGAVPFGTQTNERWESYGLWLSENGLLTGDVEPADSFTNDFVEAATESNE
jgi:putative hydroxymethylpyrimidine transport system substrate-binding protein